MANVIVGVKPELGVNYEVGDIGFTFKDGNIISYGIAWFTRWSRGENPDVPKIAVSHVFVVVGENECVEAKYPAVKRSFLFNYFCDPHTHVVFRRPTGLTPDIAARIVKSAEARIGESYGVALIIGHLLANSLIGRFLCWLTRGWTDRKIKQIFDSHHQLICSELASTALSEQPEYSGKGILRNPPHTIDPEALFNARDIFEPWATEIKGERSRPAVVRVQRPSR